MGSFLRQGGYGSPFRVHKLLWVFLAEVPIHLVLVTLSLHRTPLLSSGQSLFRLIKEKKSDRYRVSPATGVDLNADSSYCKRNLSVTELYF